MKRSSTWRQRTKGAGSHQELEMEGKEKKMKGKEKELEMKGKEKKMKGKELEMKVARAKEVTRTKGGGKQRPVCPEEVRLCSFSSSWCDP